MPAHLEEVDVSGIAALHAMPPQPPWQAALQLIDDLRAPRHEACRPVLAHLPMQDTVLLKPFSGPACLHRGTIHLYDFSTILRMTIMKNQWQDACTA